MSHRLRKLRLLTLPAVACLALASCQQAEPAPEPSVTATAASPGPETPTPTSSPEPTPKPATAEGPAENIPIPEMPELAKNHDEAGALSFLHYYFELMNYALDTYDPYPLIEHTSQYCAPCGDNFINPLGRHAELGHWQVGGHYSLNTLAVEQPENGRTLVIFSITNDEQVMYSAPNQVIKESAANAEEQIGTATLEYQNGWKLYNFTFASEESG